MPIKEEAVTKDERGTCWPDEIPAPLRVRERVVLHVDCDCFFLAVHAWHDPRLRNAGPLVLWQYNDVICVSPEAKIAGVRKHMRPPDALPIVERVGGHMVHAYCRRWPGPRVWYGPYNQFSRRVFSFLRAYLAQECVHGAVLEKASIDEAFVDVTDCVEGSLERGAALARGLADLFLREVGIRASIGVGTNRLISKMASVAAKPPADGICIVGGHGHGSCSDLLARTPAFKLPGFGGRTSDFARLGIESVADVQKFPVDALQVSLGICEEQAAQLSRMSRGIDTDLVKAAGPKKSLSVTSWLTDAMLGDLAAKTHLGRGGPAFIVGSGWLFEPQVDAGISNMSRGRWLLLALALDLEERVVDEFLEFGILPTKLTVGYQQPGHAKEPGAPGFTDGKSRSRTADFPTGAFRGLDAALDVHGGSAATVEEGPLTKPRVVRHAAYGSDFLSPGNCHAAVKGLVDGPASFNANQRLKSRVAAVVDACCSMISAWAKEGSAAPIPVAHLTLRASCMLTADGMRGSGSKRPRSSGPSVPVSALASQGPGQRKLADLWKGRRLDDGRDAALDSPSSSPLAKTLEPSQRPETLLEEMSRAIEISDSD